jgi:hypothetical protein
MQTDIQFEIPWVRGRSSASSSSSSSSSSSNSSSNSSSSSESNSSAGGVGSRYFFHIYGCVVEGRGSYVPLFKPSKNVPLFKPDDEDEKSGAQAPPVQPVQQVRQRHGKGGRQ